MYAGFFDRTDIEIIGIHKIHDNDAEKIIIVQFRSTYIRQATKQLIDLWFYFIHRNTCTKNIQQLHLHTSVLFIHNGIA
ncbi:hypothetical protein D3C73_1169750 [compost metagenome]